MAPGIHVDLSLLECMTQSMQGHEWLHASLMGLREFTRSVEIPSIEPAKDGWVGMSMVTGQQWRDFATMVGQATTRRRSGALPPAGSVAATEEVYALIHPWLAARTVAEIVDLASLFRVPMAALGNGATIPEMDHFVERRASSSTTRRAFANRGLRGRCRAATRRRSVQLPPSARTSRLTCPAARPR